MADGDSVIKKLSDGSVVKIIEAGNGTEQIHIHHHKNGDTISLYDKKTGAPAKNYDGTPQRFTWGKPKSK
jgi:hypothetical protein